MKTTIRIELETGILDKEWVKQELIEKARDAFPDAESIVVESEDGTSETVYTRKK
jgi:hypothetical protein